MLLAAQDCLLHCALPAQPTVLLQRIERKQARICLTHPSRTCPAADKGKRAGRRPAQGWQEGLGKDKVASGLAGNHRVKLRPALLRQGACQGAARRAMSSVTK